MPKDRESANTGSTWRLLKCAVFLGAAFGCIPLEAVAACAEKVGKDLPTAAPSEVGISSASWVSLNEAIDSSRHEVRALLVIRGCKLVFERYKVGIGREHNHSLYSVTKSVSATLVGALLHQGTFKSIDVPVADVVTKPDRTSSENWAKANSITLRNVMQMSSGLAYRHDPVAHPIYDTREDRLAVAFAPESQASPGTRFLYSDGDVSVTGAVIASVAQSDLLNYGKKVLFDPMEMSNVAWFFRDRVGRYPGGWGLRLRPMDMAKFGQLYLQKGEWNGTRVFSPEFLEDAWRPGPNPAYGLHWWIGSHPSARGAPYYFANGFKGQRIYIFPTLDAVVVMSASLPGNEESVVTPMVIKALADSIAAGADSADLQTDARLKTIETRGFRGEIRVFQENQDDPRRF